jgi:hypothetical protein
MKLTLLSAILWTLCSICFAIWAILTFISGGPIWLGIIQAIAAIIDGIDAGLYWRNWSLERAWNKRLKK